MRQTLGGGGSGAGVPAGVRSLHRGERAPYQRKGGEGRGKGHLNVGYPEHPAALVHGQYNPPMVHPPLGGQVAHTQRANAPPLGNLPGKGH